jgi:transaldolase
MTESRTGHGLRLFLDSADTAAWERWLPTGIFHGVTTNPVLLERAGETCSVDNLAALASRARDMGAREIHLQTWGDDEQAMTDRGARLAILASDDLSVAVKVPVTNVGLRVARTLAGKGATVTLTAVYQPGQVVAAAGFGAAYAAPYLGRLDDAGRDGKAAALAMHDILLTTASTTRLLTASLRSADIVVDLARQGLDTFTFGPAVAEQLLASDLTDAAAADFHRAAQAMGDDR